MKFASGLLLLLTVFAQAQERALHWKMESADDIGLSIQGQGKNAPGVSGKSLVVEGQSVITLEDSSQLNAGPAGFTFIVWFNPYRTAAGQQVIAAKNRYSLGERQWSLVIEPDGSMQAYVRQKGWLTLSSQEALKPGQWHQAALTVNGRQAALYLNGQLAAEAALQHPMVSTAAPITLGGVNDDGSSRQPFHGALDEVRYLPRALTSEEISQGWKPVTATHPVPKPLAAELPLWDESRKLGPPEELPSVSGTRFSVIKPYEPEKDGYRFLHGLGLAFHKGRLYASFAHNKGAENTVTEQARYRVSDDQGRTWGPVQTLAEGEEGIGISHGSFLSHDGNLWAFMGAYEGFMENIHTRAYRLDESTGKWQALGTVIKDGFWPMQQPLKMADGNWIMAGISAKAASKAVTHPAAVAISHGADFTRWDLVPIPAPDGLKMWGESTVIVTGSRVLNISRYGAERKALIAVSEDHGRTWTPSLPSNLPMITSKPYAGTLSTGQHYLVCSTAEGISRRAPLTIALTRPGEAVFSRVLTIRPAEFPDGPGESHPAASLSYPYAVEHQGSLYVAYSNNGGGAGRSGEGRTRANNNSAELAIIPLTSLSGE